MASTLPRLAALIFELLLRRLARVRLHRLGYHHPRLLATCPYVQVRTQPRRIIERARLDRDGSFPPLRLVVHTGSTVRTKRSNLGSAGWRCRAIDLRLTFADFEYVFADDHRHAESAARLPLALGTVTRNDLPRFATNLVSNGSALTTPRVPRLHSSLQVQAEPRS